MKPVLILTGAAKKTGAISQTKLCKVWLPALCLCQKKYHVQQISPWLTGPSKKTHGWQLFKNICESRRQFSIFNWSQKWYTLVRKHPTAHSSRPPLQKPCKQLPPAWGRKMRKQATAQAGSKTTARLIKHCHEIKQTVTWRNSAVFSWDCYCLITSLHKGLLWQDPLNFIIPLFKVKVLN